MKITGFKSFVDSTHLYFNSNKLAVVGPNGCGKSNVIDAIRWVMGESSPKFLRGDMMSDVIFNGSMHRKAVGVASVEIVLDNSNAYLQGAYVKKGDVSLRREIHRNGESNYYINQQRVRRKDLTDLWLGTGAGSRGYAIIGQNMVNQLVEANPEVLKTYLEEAAGVSKYKERRKESAERLVHVSDNLSRIADIIHELEQSLTRLEKESKDAKHYQELRQKLRFSQEQLQMLQAKKTIERYHHVNTQASTQEFEEQKFHDEYIQAEQNLKQFDERFNQLQQEIAIFEQDLYKAKIDLKQQNDFYQQRQHEKERYLKEQEHLAIEKDELVKQTQADENLFQDLKLAIAQSNQVFETVDKTTSTQKILLDKLQFKLREQQQLKGQVRQKTQQCSTQVQILQAKKEQSTLAFTQLQTDIQKLKAQFNNNNLDYLSQKIQLLEQEVKPQEQSIELLKADATLFKTQVDNAQKIHHQAQKSFDESQKEYDALRRDMLGKEAAYLGLVGHQKNSTQSPPAPWCELTEWLRGWQIPSEWQKIIDYLWQSFLPDYAIEQIHKANFFEPMPHAYYSGMRQSGKHLKFQSLLSFMQVDSLPAGFLNWSKIFIGQDFSKAQEFMHLLADDESLLFQEGIWLGKDWVFYLPIEENNHPGLATRLNAWRNAEQAYLNFEQRFQQSQNDLQQVLEKYLQSKQQLEIQVVQLDEKERLLQEQKQKLQSFQTQYQFILQEHERQRIELHLAEEKYAKFIEQNHLWQDEIIALEAQLNNYQQQEKQIYLELDNLQTDASNLEKQYTSSIKQAHDQKLEMTRLKTQFELIQQQLPKTKSRLMQLEQRLSELYKQIEIFEKDLSQPQDWLLEKTQKIENDTLALNQRQLEIQVAKEKRLDLVTQVETMKKNHLQLLEKKWRILSEKEQQQKSYEEVIEIFGADLQSEVWHKLENHDEKLLKKYIEQLESQLSELGDVNLLAVGLYQQEQERLSQFILQENDLKQAVLELDGAIKTLDEDMQTELQKTLQAINHHLSEIFPQLFGGGEAKFVASCDNLLEATVAVQVQAPGKKQHRIQLLSGGEKALTAVALLFSIFSLNPAPFCLLDEVDAALDDANVQRLANLIDKLSSSVQFILITHNPLTMDVADELIGVTMQEPGVSRVVTVNMATALDMVNKE